MTDWTYENQAKARGYRSIVGLDEAGRGPLAGPVVAAAVILPEGFEAPGLNDSKKMTARARDHAYDLIVRESVAYGVGIVGPDVIDEINILQATHRAMREALAAVGAEFDYILLDGLFVPGLPAPSHAIVKGDSLSISISAASVVAKVTRDRIMVEMDALYPEYGFAGHKGYGSKAHMETINRIGPCPCHRMSFSPISERIANCPLPGLD